MMLQLILHKILLIDITMKFAFKQFILGYLLF